MYVLCLDIGGTFTRAAVVGSEGLVKQIKKYTPRANSKNMLDQCKNLLINLNKVFNNKISAIAIGCAGPVKGAIMEGSKPMELSQNINFKECIGKYFNIPIFVANDLQMAIRAEKIYGHGHNIKNFSLITLSTGIGVAIVLNNKILEHRIEIGHNIIETNQNIARPCTNGHSGCWVSQASGEAVQKYLTDKGLNISLEEFFKKPDQIFINSIKRANTYGIANVIHSFDPEKIIIMGSLGTKQFDKIIPSSFDIKSACLLRPIPQIIKSKLGDEIGLLGAYEFAKEKLVDKYA